MSTPEELRAEIEQQREALAETVDALQTTVTTQAKAAVRPAAVGAAVLAVVFVGYLVLRRRRRHGD